jgi:hypothetical protein
MQVHAWNTIHEFLSSIILFNGTFLRKNLSIFVNINTLLQFTGNLKISPIVVKISITPGMDVT